MGVLIVSFVVNPEFIATPLLTCNTCLEYGAMHVLEWSKRFSL